MDLAKWNNISQTYTLPETNIPPENRPSQKETSIPTIHFRCELLVSGRVDFPDFKGSHFPSNVAKHPQRPPLPVPNGSRAPTANSTFGGWKRGVWIEMIMKEKHGCFLFLYCQVAVAIVVFYKL